MPRLAVFTAAFTPIPYKVFTIAGGVCKISLLSLFLGSVAGRAGRFFLVAGLIYIFGPPIKKFIDKYFDWLAIAFTVLLIGGFVVVKKFM
jgi:membrane protein DedA with SNARE-associated domain